MVAARKTNDDAALSEAQAASRSPEAPETAAPAAPTLPVPPSPPACPTCGAELELYAGINPHKVGQGWCPICQARKPLEG